MIPEPPNYFMCFYCYICYEFHIHIVSGEWNICTHGGQACIMKSILFGYYLRVQTSLYEQTV